MACRILRTAEWTERLLHEINYRKCKGYFLTLTYNDDNLPKDGKLKKYHLKNFLEELLYEYKLKRNKGKRRPAYYFIGEYGDRTKRPHYHGILIGHELNSEKLYRKGNQIISDEINKYWRYGYHTVGSVTKESCNYVTGYIRKKIINKEYKTDEFQIVSKSIGKNYLISNYDKIFKVLCDDSRKAIVPRYYKKLINDNSPMRKNIIMEKLNERKNRNIEINYKGNLEDYTLQEYKDMIRRQADNDWREKNLKKGSL